MSTVTKPPANAAHKAPAPARTSPAAAKAAAASFAALMERLDYLDAASIEQVRQAYRFADEAHLGQLRSNGDPYITHPIAVAAQCATWRLDAQALMAALLHDAMEDCGVTKVELIERFGAPVAELVDGLTKLDKLSFNTREEGQAESFRKMLLAMARDVRVILIKLADRSHNMRTLGDVPRAKWARTSQETLDIYAPIAYRMGLNQLYRELQDLCLRHLHPWRYAILSKALTKARSRRRDLLNTVRRQVESAFAEQSLSMRLLGREKSVFSIYAKMKHKHLSFAQVTDIYGFRTVVPQLLDCYLALGVLHQLYKPLPGKFKDHIAIAKINGYQSVHTTVVGPAGVSVEFQIRTEDMDVVAESGVAAHWLYKSSAADSASATRLGTQWLQSLLDIQQETRDATEFWDHVKVDLFSDAVYVFTPKSQIMTLPRGSTAVDFAYAVHTKVGDKTVAAKINGQSVPLRSELKNGDVVEVITEPTAKPNPAWLGFVRSARARSKIRQHLKTQQQTESVALGETLLSNALRAEGLDALPATDATHRLLWDKLLRFTGNKTRAELLTEIGLGRRIASIVAKRMATLMVEQGAKPDALLITRERFMSAGQVQPPPVALDGSENVSIKYASCCRPVPGDAIVGYLGRGEGLLVHTADCAVALRQRHKDSERFTSVEWSDEPQRSFETGVVVTVNNGKGVLARVAAALTAAEVDINHVDMGDEAAQDTIDLRFVVGVRDAAQLDSALQKLRRVPAVVKAVRAKPQGFTA